MRAIIIAHVIIWSFFLLALTPWLLMARNAMDTCQMSYSYATCVTVLR